MLNKKKLNCIEDYIFAKTLNLTAKNTIVSRENAENYTIVKQVTTASEKLLLQIKENIKKFKLDNISLWVLEKELETESLYKNQEQNLIKIKEMLPKLNQMLTFSTK